MSDLKALAQAAVPVFIATPSNPWFLSFRAGGACPERQRGSPRGICCAAFSVAAWDLGVGRQGEHHLLCK